jgi:DNA-binding beta-propeller fold protein YncE
MDPLDPFVYVANQNSSSISAYVLGSGGVLTALTDSPFANAGSPAALAVDPTGQFVYVANAAAGTVSVFAIASASGGLSPVNGLPYTAGSSPSAIAISD